MENTILSNIGLDPVYLIILLFLIQVLLFVMLISVNMKYNRLKTSYSSFMKGKDGKNLEESMLTRFSELDEIAEIAKKNQIDIQDIYKKMKLHYQKIGIVKYDAFHEMGGNLSFALTMLDENDNGWILNAMHSREGCYIYMKEVDRGQTDVVLGNEEQEALEQALGYVEKKPE